MLDLVNWLQENDYAKGLGFAVFGGFVRIFTGNKKRLRAKMVLSGMLTATFVGIVGIELIQYYKLDRRLIGLTNILFGYCHEEMVAIITAKFLSRLKKEERGNDDLQL